eukprot:541848-Prorocentrum_minimum.AAC.2
MGPQDPPEDRAQTSLKPVVCFRARPSACWGPPRSNSMCKPERRRNLAQGNLAIAADLGPAEQHLLYNEQNSQR